MSPSESDLRDALRFGEDEGPDGLDVDRILAGAHAQRARRVRVLTTAAAVVLVAGLGTTAAVTWTSGGGTSADRAGSANAAAGGKAPSAPKHRQEVQSAAGAAGTGGGVSGGGASVPGPMRAVPQPSCPAHAPQLRGEGTGPLFARPVQTVVVCSYGTELMATRGGVRPVRAVLGVAESRLLVRSIETADTTHVARFCLPQRPATTRVLAFVPLTSSGARLPTVAATIEDPPCDLQVSNGTDVRYNWTPPPSLLRRLEALRPTAVVAPPTPNPVTTTPR